MQAQAQAYEGSNNGLPGDVFEGGMPQVSPDQLGQLLSARNQTSTSASFNPKGEGDLSIISMTQKDGTGGRGESNFGSVSELEKSPHPHIQEFLAGDRVELEV